jgi:hypothetical protein
LSGGTFAESNKGAAMMMRNKPLQNISPEFCAGGFDCFCFVLLFIYLFSKEYCWIGIPRITYLLRCSFGDTLHAVYAGTQFY